MISSQKPFRIFLCTIPLFLGFPNANIQESSSAANVERKICYIEKIFTEPGMRFIIFDTIDWFQGEKAVIAYKEDHPGSTASLPDGYYIRNRVNKWDTLAIAGTAQFVMQTYSRDSEGNFRRNEQIDIDQFTRLFSEHDHRQYKRIPFWMAISHGRILSIAEQYIP